MRRNVLGVGRPDCCRNWSISRSRRERRCWPGLLLWRVWVPSLRLQLRLGLSSLRIRLRRARIRFRLFIRRRLWVRRTIRLRGLWVGRLCGAEGDRAANSGQVPDTRMEPIMKTRIDETFVVQAPRSRLLPSVIGGPGPLGAWVPPAKNASRRELTVFHWFAVGS